MSSVPFFVGKSTLLSESAGFLCVISEQRTSCPASAGNGMYLARDYREGTPTTYRKTNAPYLGLYG